MISFMIPTHVHNTMQINAHMHARSHTQSPRIHIIMYYAVNLITEMQTIELEASGYEQITCRTIHITDI